MTDPIQYPSSTPRFALPLLFAGQAQKEFFINAALSRCDALVQPAVEGEASAPPVQPAEGECWLLGAGAADAFAGRAGELAVRRSNEWIFIAPQDGMRIYDRSTGQFLLFAGAWRREGGIAPPTGGQTIDAEARTAIGELIATLTRCGILPSN